MAIHLPSGRGSSSRIGVALCRCGPGRAAPTATRGVISESDTPAVSKQALSYAQPLIQKLGVGVTSVLFHPRARVVWEFVQRDTSKNQMERSREHER